MIFHRDALRILQRPRIPIDPECGMQSLSQTTEVCYTFNNASDSVDHNGVFFPPSYARRRHVSALVRLQHLV
jgi:hypothetical protein